MDFPDPDVVRRALANLDARDSRIVAGLLAMMMREPQRVRDREWMAERLTQVTLLAGELEADTPKDGVRRVQEFLLERAEPLLGAALLLFKRLGLDPALMSNPFVAGIIDITGIVIYMSICWLMLQEI